MRRKVIQIADSTQLVSIPRKWAVKHNLKKGDELEVKEELHRLIIETDHPVEGNKIDVEISHLDRDSLMYFVRALYKNGYDEIIIRFREKECENLRLQKNERVMDIIHKEVGRLTGVEIFTQKEGVCIIKSISEDSIKGFDNMLRRVFILSVEAMKDFVDGFERGDQELLESIQQKHDVITKFVVYCQRLLKKIGYPDQKKADQLYHILEVIDTIMDLIKYNAREENHNNKKGSKESIIICKGILQSYEHYGELFYKFSFENVYLLNKSRYELLEKKKELLNKIPREELNIIKNMEQILEYILNLTNARMALEY